MTSSISYLRASAVLAIAISASSLLLAQSPQSISLDASSSVTSVNLAELSIAESSSSLPDAPTPADTQTLIPPSPKNVSHTSGGATGYVFPDFAQRRRHYLYELVGPGAFIAPLITATVDQTHSLKVGYPSDGYPGAGMHPAHGAPVEWGEGFGGYSKRYASRFGMGLVGTTTRYGLGEVLHEDVSYHRCDCSGVLPRTFHAVTQAYIAHTPSGRGVPSIPALVSPFVAAEVGVAGWYPSRYKVSDALRTSTSLYISVPLKNIVAEFTGR